MKLDLKNLFYQNSITARGIIHVGAYRGKEIENYLALGISKILCIEANPKVFESLKANMAEASLEVQAVNCAISNRNGKVTFYVNSMEQSSSILPLKHYRDIYPNVKEIEQITVESKSLDFLLQELELSPTDFNLLNLDIQGTELLALEGASNLLKYIDAICCKVNYQELYEGCALIDGVDEFLLRHDFRRQTVIKPFHPSWGEAFYVGEKIAANLSAKGKSIKSVAMEELEAKLELLEEELKNTQSEKERVLGELERSQRELLEAKSELQQTEDKLTDSQSQLQQMAPKLHQAQSKFYSCQTEVAQTQSLLHQTQEELEESGLELRKTGAELKNTESQRDEFSQQLASTLSQLQQTKTELASCKSELQQTCEELEKSKSQRDQILAELERSHSQLIETKELAKNAGSQLQETSAKLEKTESQREELYQQLALANSQLKETKEVAKNAESKLQGKSAKLEKTQSQREELYQQLASANSQLKETKELAKNAESKLQEKSAKLETTQSQREELSQKLASSESQLIETKELAKNAELKLQETSAKLERTESQREELSQKLASSESQLIETKELAKNAESKLQETSAKLEKTESQREELSQKLASSESQLKETKELAKNSELQLQQIQTELDKSRSQLHDTREELEITQFQLDEVQAELEQSQSQLFENKEELNGCKYQFQPGLKMQPAKNGFHGGEKEMSQTLCHPYPSREELKNSMFELQQTQTKLAHNPELIYPSVNLFLYDLRESLGQDLEVKKNRIKFWRKIDPELDKQINELVTINPQDGAGKPTLVDSPLEKKLKDLAAKENPEAEYKLLYQKAFSDWVPGSNLDGYCLAVELGDTYSLVVNCSGSYVEGNARQKNNSPQPIAALATNQKNIISSINHRQDLAGLEPEKQGNLGESWFVWGQLCDDRSDSTTVAEECYKQLNPNSPEKPNFKKVGEFEGAEVFESWNIPTNWGQKWENFAGESYRLIVCLFPPSENPEQIEINRNKIQKIYFDLARLFCYRHKVIWAYWQSRRLKKELKLQSKEIQKLVDEVQNIGKQIEEKKPLQLGELQLTLTDILPLVSSYADGLFLLENQAKTVAVNLENYGRRLASMEENNNSNLEGWKEFRNFAAEKYHQQIESDCINLSPELKVLENSIATMRGIIDIEQAKGDRELTQTVAVVGTAVTVSGVMATVAVGGDSPPKSYVDLSFMKSPSFVLSILPVAIALLILVWRRRGRG